MNRLSIRWRLTLWNTVALAALLVAIGLVVYALLRHAMYEQIPRVLAAQYREAAAHFRTIHSLKLRNGNGIIGDGFAENEFYGKRIERPVPTK